MKIISIILNVAEIVILIAAIIVFFRNVAVGESISDSSSAVSG